MFPLANIQELKVFFLEPGLDILDYYCLLNHIQNMPHTHCTFADHMKKQPA